MFRSSCASSAWGLSSCGFAAISRCASATASLHLPLSNSSRAGSPKATADHATPAATNTHTVLLIRRSVIDRGCSDQLQQIAYAVSGPVPSHCQLVGAAPLTVYGVG